MNSEITSENNNELNPPSRDELFENIKQQNHWDVIVIGGGITGAGIFRQCARQGLKVLLVEQQDFAWGTSSRSSKMVHGGFRYIAQGDIQLTKEALHEREQMLKEVPGLVDRMQFVFPLRKGRFPGRFSLGILLKVYDLLAGVNDSSYIKNPELEKQVQGLDIINMKGAIGYSDAITDDTRLVMRVIQEGKRLGGHALNYVKAVDLEKDKQGNVQALALRREDTGMLFKLNATVIVNATGAWADNLMGLQGSAKKIRPLRGSHLVLKADKFPLENALTLVHPDDGRPVFMFPWYGRILLGTTDLDYPEDLDKEAAITQQEIDYLLKVVNEFFPYSKVSREDIVSSFCGVRPVISSGKGVDPSKEKRGHSIWQEHNLISVSGGKLTIWRIIADEVNELIAPYFPENDCKAENVIFNSFDSDEALFDSFENISGHYKRMLTGRYGELLPAFLAAFPETSYKEIKNYAFSLADCFWAIHMEQVVHLDDLMLRRTRLGLLQDDPLLLQDLCLYIARHLGWSEAQAKEELERYKEIRRCYYPC